MAKFKSLLLEDYEYGDIDVPEKYDDLDFEPPSAAQDNAQQVIDWKDEHGRDEVKGMNQTGWQRANQLADGVEVSPDVIGRMASFARHEKNKEVADEYEDEPWKDKGHVAWLGWGGDEGVEWAQEMQDKMDKIDQQNEMKLTESKLRQLIREEVNNLVNEKGRYYDQHGYQKYKKKLEGTVVNSAEATDERLTFMTRLRSYTVYGDSVRLNGKRISGITSPFVERKREVKNITKRETKGKFGSTESLFIEVGSNMTFKVREPRKFNYSMDRKG